MPLFPRSELAQLPSHVCSPLSVSLRAAACRRRPVSSTRARCLMGVEVVEHVAEVTEKLAADAASSMPENGSLHKVAVEVECVAEAMDKDAHKVEAVNDKDLPAAHPQRLIMPHDRAQATASLCYTEHISEASIQFDLHRRRDFAIVASSGLCSFTLARDNSQSVLTRLKLCISMLFRFCTTGLPSDVTVEVGDVSFHLHKFLLLSKSAFLEWSIEENSDQEECIIKLNVIPGVPSHLS
ncbi:hypothetical protein ZEAMMB73_Zm00001d015629 [Zea mays]|uniref:Uncharacterized protein n=1 Tax=Zea mays TaxID=4577 RepID=A0A1D6H312_MAIZE|nr:hypothetical protein ZEAMMB73_Zm00001d015629 [Zea mays]